MPDEHPTMSPPHRIREYARKTNYSCFRAHEGFFEEPYEICAKHIGDLDGAEQSLLAAAIHDTILRVGCKRPGGYVFVTKNARETRTFSVPEDINQGLLEGVGEFLNAMRSVEYRGEETKRKWEEMNIISKQMLLQASFFFYLEKNGDHIHSSLIQENRLKTDTSLQAEVEILETIGNLGGKYTSFLVNVASFLDPVLNHAHTTSVEEGGMEEVFVSFLRTYNTHRKTAVVVLPVDALAHVMQRMVEGKYTHTRTIVHTPPPRTILVFPSCEFRDEWQSLCAYTRYVLVTLGSIPWVEAEVEGSEKSSSKQREKKEAEKMVGEQQEERRREMYARILEGKERDGIRQEGVCASGGSCPRPFGLVWQNEDRVVVRCSHEQVLVHYHFGCWKQHTHTAGQLCVTKGCTGRWMTADRLEGTRLVHSFWDVTAAHMNSPGTHTHTPSDTPPHTPCHVSDGMSVVSGTHAHTHSGRSPSTVAGSPPQKYTRTPEHTSTTHTPLPKIKKEGKKTQTHTHTTPSPQTGCQSVSAEQYTCQPKRRGYGQKPRPETDKHLPPSSASHALHTHTSARVSESVCAHNILPEGAVILPQELVCAQRVVGDAPVVAVIPAVMDRRKQGVSARKQKRQRRIKLKPNRPVPLRVLQRRMLGLEKAPAGVSGRAKGLTDISVATVAGTSGVVGLGEREREGGSSSSSSSYCSEDYVSDSDWGFD
eukprot:GDKI01032514.1.p1 GENE.GDKI01032514.1~~GDKI01032514.1.p1  ORF type:complete len:708 (-),score=182.14 GDKI01032514.1:118-2241(-)